MNELEKAIETLQGERGCAELYMSNSETRIVMVPGHGELSADQEKQMIAFMEYLLDKRKKELEREQGCEWCERDEDGQMRLIWECGLDHFDFELNFCPNCGQKLKED